jgi:predicted transcriptional regulator
MVSTERLIGTAQQLRDGKLVPSLTVREFLSWFEAQRRTSLTVYRIRRELLEAKLLTDPDFESAYIDSSIEFKLKPEISQEIVITPEPAKLALSGLNPSVIISDSITVSDKTELTIYNDPTYRISKLEAANKKPVFVTPNNTLQEAVTIMLINDFSQLPVMINEREVKGVLSWTSIGSRLSLRKDGSQAKEFMDQHQEILADSSLFQAIPIIVQYQYVLIRGSDKRITGIVTASDLSLQFKQLSEPFLLLGEVENHIRNIIRQKLSPEELSSVKDPNDNKRIVSGVDDLTFGEYIRLLENPDRWNKVGLPIDRATFCKELGRVRDIRNDVMHFDPDGIPPNDLECLRGVARFLQELQRICRA